MSGGTVVFLVIGGAGVLFLGLALIGHDLFGLDHSNGGLWSMEALAGFTGAFGFVGAIATEVGGPALGVAVGIVAAVPTAYLAFRLSRAARNMRTDATPTRADLVGSLGVVVTSIPLQGYGEVRVRIGGQPVKLNARAERAIALGAHVFVVDAPSDTSVVVEETTLPS